MNRPAPGEALGAGRTDLDGCQQRIGYRFRDPLLLEAALTHASGAETRLASNERLEFLGDAILGSMVCERLFRDYPSFLEGDLTRIKSIVVSRQVCTKISQRLALRDFLILGKGMASEAEVPASILADVFESLLAAVYLDGGVEAARSFVDRTLGEEIELAVSGATGENFKSQLQQETQKTSGQTPTYLLLDEKGPDHSKCFMMAAQVGKTRFPPAWGRSKKEAEQRAAENAIRQLQGKPPVEYEHEEEA